VVQFFLINLKCTQLTIIVCLVKKKRKKRKNMIGVLVIRVPLRSDPIDVTQSHAVFLEEDFKKRISIFHLLEGN